MRYSSSLSLLVLFPTLFLGAVGTTPKVITSSWYPGWRGTDYPPENVPWYGYNVAKYAFATTTSNPSVIGLTSCDENLLPRFVSLAHKNHVLASLSIGGWTGSQYFSSAVATEVNRTKFVNAVLSLVSKYNLDGIDFDWEYPNKPGIGWNTRSPSDSSNFLLFLQQLRGTALGRNISLSAAVSITPFAGSNGNPLGDVSAFAKVLDYIEIMVYDIWGPWSSVVGPNAPLNDTCNSVYHEGSAVSAVRAWTAARFPSSQIVLGVPSYGHSFFVKKSDAIQGGKLVAYPPFDATKQPHGDSWDGTAGTDQCGSSTQTGGLFNFWGLINDGFLTKGGTPAPGIYHRFGSCSQTPYVYNPNTEVMVSYDDARSFAAKGHYITNSKLKGFSMWHAAGDYNNILLNSIRGAMGL